MFFGFFDFHILSLIFMDIHRFLFIFIDYL